jgi:ABC-2 type transport system permease protein
VNTNLSDVIIRSTSEPAIHARRSSGSLGSGGSFRRVVRAELQRVCRRRSLIAIGIGATLFSVVAGVSVWLAAGDVVENSRDGGARISDLAATGGGTVAFAIGASFGGFLVFVTFIALIAGEFSNGTFRANLLRYPHRTRLILGKLTGLLLVAAVALAVAAVISFGVSWLMAPTQDVSTDGWLSAASLAEAIRDYGTVLAGVAGWAVFGTTLAVLFRSIPLALGVGFAWAGPFENIVVESWSPGFRYFPGQVLGSLMRGGTVELGLQRAALTTLVYTALAFAATLILVTRRDVTS